VQAQLTLQQFREELEKELRPQEDCRKAKEFFLRLDKVCCLLRRAPTVVRFALNL